jgi:GNAT superfamily N-acetyltransferase
MPRLVRKATNEIIEAELLSNLSGSEVSAADEVWLDFQRTLIQHLTDEDRLPETFPEHLHWRWSHKARFYRGRTGYEFLGIRYAERIQGLMLLDYTRFGRLVNQVGLPLVYVDYVAVAPWNLNDFANSPEYTGVGRALLNATIQKSRSLGFQGRIALHSLPQAEDFYRKISGMVDVGPDTQYHGLRYFERGQEAETK